MGSQRVRGDWAQTHNLQWVCLLIHQGWVTNQALAFLKYFEKFWIQSSNDCQLYSSVDWQVYWNVFLKRSWLKRWKVSVGGRVLWYLRLTLILINLVKKLRKSFFFFFALQSIWHYSPLSELADLSDDKQTKVQQHIWVTELNSMVPGKHCTSSLKSASSLSGL